MRQALLKILQLALVCVSMASMTCCATENRYTFTNSSFVEITVSAWFTKAIQGSRKTAEGEGASGFGLSSNSLPVPDFQLILKPQETESITDQAGQVQSGECLAYFLAEYRVIPSIAPSFSSGPGIPADLYLVGKRFWAQKLPGLCGDNTIELNYDPATYLKFSLKINGMDDYLRDVV